MSGFGGPPLPVRVIYPSEGNNWQAEYLKATVAAEQRARDLAELHDKLVARIEALEETTGLLASLIDHLVDDIA